MFIVDPARMSELRQSDRFEKRELFRIFRKFIHIKAKLRLHCNHTQTLTRSYIVTN